jgi:FtsH-binding integral membrane protein
MGFSLPISRPLERTGAERAVLVRRTYGLVLIGVLCTVAGVAFALTQPALLDLSARHPILSFLAAFAPLWFAMRNPTAFPLNVSLVLLFTLLEGICLAPVIAIYGAHDPSLIWQAGGLTVSTFGVLTAYAWISRRDFSAWGSFFVVGLWVVIVTSLLNLFFHSESVSLAIAGAAVLVFSGLLIFDTWRIRHVFGPDDYVIAAVTIYLDLLNLFLALLSLLGGGRRR